MGEVWIFSGIKHWFGHGLLTAIIYCYMQTILQADWLQSRAVTRFSSGDVQKVAVEFSCCRLVNNLFLCQRSQGAMCKLECPWGNHQPGP